MFTLSNDQDGRPEAAAAIKKALASTPSRRDTIEKLSGRAPMQATALTREAALGMFRKRKGRLSTAEMQAIGKALAKGFPPNSSNAASTDVMPDTGAANNRSSQFGVNDVVPQAETGARNAADDPTVAALKSIYTRGPQRAFG